MAVFYTREKAKLGTLTGTIIHFSQQLQEDNDPIFFKEELPAGYLRCDGKVLDKNIYPALAAILGTGTGCKFRKDAQVLTDDQFQLPDFRQKHIRSTSSSDVGRYNDVFVTRDDGVVIDKAGVGMDVVQIAPSPFEVSFEGKFFLPSQTVSLSGQPSFTRSTGNVVSSAEVLQNMIQPHAHHSTTYRARQLPAAGHTRAAVQNNSTMTTSSLDVCRWWAHTRQDLAYWYASNKAGDATRPTTDGNAIDSWWYGDYDVGGICKTGCDMFRDLEMFIWPDCTHTSALFSNSEYPIPTTTNSLTTQFYFGSHNDGSCNHDTPSGHPYGALFGEIYYAGKYFQRCVPALGNVGSVDGKYPNNPWAFGANTENWSLTGTPFAQLGYFDGFQEQSAAVSNITTRVGLTGDTGEHVHQMPFEVEPHTYEIVTSPVDITANNTITSRINITVNPSHKADEFIQPYVICEYLIKY